MGSVSWGPIVKAMCASLAALTLNCTEPLGIGKNWYSSLSSVATSEIKKNIFKIYLLKILLCVFSTQLLNSGRDLDDIFLWILNSFKTVKTKPEKIGGPIWFWEVTIVAFSLIVCHILWLRESVDWNNFSILFSCKTASNWSASTYILSFK